MNGYELYNIAKKHIGEGGSKFRKYCGLPSGSAYCNAYVCYVANEGGVKSLFFDGAKETYCPHSIKWCKTHLAQIPLYLAMPMDIIYFDWNNNNVPDHIGFVKNRVNTSEIETHEGNTSGGIVDEKKRKAQYVLGVFRPHFKGSYNISKPLKVDGKFDYSSIAMLQKALGLKVDGILGKDTVKALQKKAKVTPDGAWGKNTSKAVQKMVGATADGQFGINSVKALQKWTNKQVQFKTDGKTTETVKKEVAPTPTPQPPSPSKYSGEFPDFVVHSRNYLEMTAKNLAYAKGTSSKTYNYKTGKPKVAFTTAIKKVYGKEYSKWSKQCRMGASCDVFVGTVMRYSGCDTTWKRGLDGQYGKTPKHCSTTTSISEASMLIYQGHTRMVVDINGTRYNCEANHNKNGGQYGHIGSKATKPSKSKLKMFKVTSAFKTCLSKGDDGSEVTKWQKFLKWYGFDCAVDGAFGEKTLGFTKTFQYKVGLDADGEVGSKTIAKAKEIEK